MNKINVEKFIVKLPRLGNGKKILLFSDLHLNWWSRHGLEDKISEIIKRDKIDYVVVAGDITNWKRPKCRERFEEILREINACPVFVGLGNHDLGLMGKSEREYFANLSRIKNVFPLDNKSMVMDGIEIIGFSPRFEAYSRSNINENGAKMFVDDWKKTGIKLENKPRILICHDPMVTSLVADSGELPELFNKNTLVLSGHNHNGSFPLWLDRALADKVKDYGFIPEPPFIVRKARGKHKIGDAILVISKGIHRYYFLPSAACVTEIDEKNFA